MIDWPQLIDSHDYKAIVCLDGDLPKAAFFNSHLPIIAADGAANKLTAMGVTPSIIIGDLDAVDKSLLKTIKFIHVPDQNTNDYQKVLQYLDKNNLSPAIICGMTGGCLDHILNNVNIFMGTDNILYSPPIVSFVMRNPSNRVLALSPHTKISLLGIPNAIVSSDGLKWELNQYQLNFPGQTSCFNETTQSQISLEVHEGQILVLIYQ